MRLLVAVVALGISLLGLGILLTTKSYAQTKVPACSPNSTILDNCYGTKVYGYGTYLGEWRKNKKDGQGTFTYANGDVYAGSFKNGKPHGHGVFTFSTGDIYDGEFREGKRSGRFQVRYSNGDAFYGNYDADKRLGSGVYRWKNGSHYNGSWQDGLPSAPQDTIKVRHVDASSTVSVAISLQLDDVYTLEGYLSRPDHLYYVGQEFDHVGDYFICRHAVNQKVGSWSEKDYDREYVAETERRGFSLDDCWNIISGPAVAELGPNEEAVVSAVQGLSDKIICGGALSRSKDEWDVDRLMLTYVSEAKRRGLSLQECRSVNENLAAIVVSTQPSFGGVALEHMCFHALDVSKTGWVVASNQYHVSELKRRGLSVDDCRGAIGLKPAVPSRLSVAEMGSDSNVCDGALNAERREWGVNIDYVSEAKRRGFSVSDCRVAVGLPATAPIVEPKPQPVAESAHLRKVALVIGNSAYRHAATLVNPLNDAEAIAGLLRGIGFDVIIGRDLDKRGVEETVAKFVDRSTHADLTLFYYAGHGIQVAGENFIVPVDARVEKPSAVDFELVDVSMVTNYMGGEKSVGIALLDACRDNPFTRSLSRALGTRSTLVGSGLSELRSDGGGLLVGFATAPGDVADDGIGMKNSPFTTALLKHLGSKGLEIELLMKRVKADVYETTKGRQQPWHSSALRTEVYLAGK